MGIKAVAHTGDRSYMSLFSPVPGKKGLDIGLLDQVDKLEQELRALLGSIESVSLKID